MDKIRIYFVTYNVGTSQPEQDLTELLGFNNGSKNEKTLPDFYVIGLQEVSAQPHNLLMDAIYDDPWTRVLKEALSKKGYIKIKTIRLQGLVLSLFSLREHLLNIRDVETDYTRTGLSGMWGNKGGVSIRMGLYGCSICFVNAHLCAHDHQLDERFVDYYSIIKEQEFHVLDHKQILHHDYVFLFGDLNFRLKESYKKSPEEIDELIKKKQIDELIKHDQLRCAMESKRGCHELEENPPTFPPTFKFEVGKDQYDYKRKPAWTDRILYQVHRKNYENIKLKAEQVSYSSHPFYKLSDHKPVTAEFIIRTGTQNPVNLSRSLPQTDSQVFSHYGEEVVKFDKIEQWWDNEDNTIFYEFTQDYTTHKNDWIGVYKSDFSCLDEYETYEYVHKNASPTPAPKNKSSPRPTVKNSQHVAGLHDKKYNITFSQTGNKNPGLFCLIYISETEDKVRSVLGVSKPFPLKIYCIFDSDSIYKRAYLLRSDLNKFTFWLIDYGYAVDADKIYEVPAECSKFHKLIPVGLNNIVGLKYEIGNEGSLKYTPSSRFSESTSQNIAKYLLKSNQIKFEEEREINGIKYGQIFLLNKNENWDNLTDILIKKKIAVINEQLFKVAVSSPSINTRMSFKPIKEDFKNLEFEGIGRGYNRKANYTVIRNSLGRGYSRKSVASSSSGSVTDEGNKTPTKNLEVKENSIISSKSSTTKKLFEEIEDTSKNINKKTPEKMYQEESLNVAKLEDDKEFLERMKAKMKKEMPEISSTVSSCKSSAPVSKPSRTTILKKFQKKPSATSIYKDDTIETSVTNQFQLNESDFVSAETTEPIISEASVTNVHQSEKSKEFDSSTDSEITRPKVINASELFKKLKERKSKENKNLENDSNSESFGTDENLTPNKPQETFCDVESVTSKLSQSTSLENNVSSEKTKISLSKKKQDIVRLLKENKIAKRANEDFNNSHSTEESSDTSLRDKLARFRKKSVNKTPRESSSASDCLPSGMTINTRILKQLHKKLQISKTSTSISSDCVSSATSKYKTTSLSSGHKSNKSINSDVEIPKHAANNPERGLIKLGCSCETCKMWNVNDLDLPESEVFEVKQHKKIVKPVPLIKRSDDDNNPIAIKRMTEVLSSLAHSKQLTAPQMLVHGMTIPFPQGSIKDIPFNEQIHEALKYYKFEVSLPIQSYCWPAIMRNLNVCIIDGPQTGKTMTYIPPMCSFLLEKATRYDNKHRSLGPIVIVLCPESHVAENIHKSFLSLISKVKTNTVLNITIATPPIDRNVLYQFKMACDVLITTPSTLISLLSKNVINMKRLCHLIVENTDVILSNFNHPFKEILRVTQEMLDHRSFSNQVQLMLLSEHWTPSIENLIKILNVTPIVCIGNHLESALYGRADFHILDQHTVKVEKLYDILKDLYQTYKTIIVCNKEEIREIRELFQLYGISMISADESMTGEDISDAEKPWLHSTNGENIVLVCTDAVLKASLNITSAAILVNYSLPDTWGAFCKRFGCLLDNYRSPFASSKNLFNCKVFTFIDDLSSKKFPRIANFFKNSGKLPEKYLEYLNECIQKQENNKLKNKLPLCEFLKSFGCCKKTRCFDRHKLSLDDKIRELPSSGSIKYKINRVNHVNKFSIKLISHTDLEGNEINFPDFSKDIDKYLRDKICFEFARNVKLNEWYVCDLDSELHRCIVTEVLECDEVTNVATKVKVESLDRGFIKTMSTIDMYNMPEELKQIPATCYELYVPNILPINNDSNWSYHATTHIIWALNERKFRRDDVYCTSTIYLQVQKTFWVDDLRLQTYLPEIKTVVNSFILKRYLNEKNLIDISNTPLESLRKIFEEAGLEIPEIKIDEKVVPQLNQSKPQWAFLTEDGLNNVYFSSGISPALFYVRLVKFNKLLLDFEDDVARALKEPFYRTLKIDEIEVGKMYLAPDPENVKYSRAFITKIEDDKANCFFVDFGDSAFIPLSELKYIRDDFITRLPCQAIQCNLFGIKPISDVWDEEATDVLYKYCYEDGNNDYYRLLTTCCLKFDQGIYDDNRSHNIILMDDTGDSPLIINKIIIDCGFAEHVEGEDLNIDLSIFKRNYYESDSDCSESDIGGPELTEAEMDKLYEYTGFNKAESNDENFDDEESDNGGFDVEIFNYMDFYKEFNKIPADATLLPEEPGPPTLQNETPNCFPSSINALPLSNILSPEVRWHQTDTHIKIEIKLCVNKYELTLTNDKFLYFSAIYNDKKYELNLELYESVHNFRDFAIGLVVKVLLLKKNTTEWPRLISSTEKNRNIKYDIEKCAPEEEKKRKFLDLGPDHEDEKIENTMILEIGSDVDYTTSDPDEFDSD